MRTSHLHFKIFSLLLFTLIFSAQTKADELTLFAAASLKNALIEIAVAWEKPSGNHIRFNLESSGTLARQIQEGAPADVFISADEAKMDALQQKGLILPETRKSLLSNQLAIILSKNSTVKVSKSQDLLAFKKVALGEPKTVPAGIYAKEYLTSLGLWDQFAGKILPCDNVRAALAAVESENAEAGIVYKTDALISSSIKTAFLVPIKEGPKISYPVAIVKAGKSKEAAKDFLKFLSSSKASQIFQKYGFIDLNQN